MTMEKVSHGRPITTAPADADLELSLYDEGEYHALVFPCRRDGSSWCDVRANRPMPLTVTHWRPWGRGRANPGVHCHAISRELFQESTLLGR
jgi:hypothetical protein